MDGIETGTISAPQAGERLDGGPDGLGHARVHARAEELLGHADPLPLRVRHGVVLVRPALQGRVARVGPRR